MASTNTVKRALAALAAGRGFVPGDTDTDDRRADRVVADAETAVERLDTAAAFLAEGGETRLRRAVARADAQNRRTLVRRGQRVLATLDRFRTVANETDVSAGGRHARAHPTENVKPAGGQRPDR
ncbi:hypothetical protein [Salinirubrum litoreum]|uniref:Uncharacterized protein n=1 Tax=Salinirubrum litoreum TaxID=1126234 RepID=A0ABD5RBT0_9EURY|nr:hypothetical protein [Salinirubrum litoreum]